MSKFRSLVDGFRDLLKGKPLSFSSTVTNTETGEEKKEIINIHFDKFLEDHNKMNLFYEGFSDFIHWYYRFRKEDEGSNSIMVTYISHDDSEPDSAVSHNEDGSINLRITDPEMIELMTRAHPSAFQIAVMEIDREKCIAADNEGISSDDLPDVDSLDEIDPMDLDIRPVWTIYVEDADGNSEDEVEFPADDEVSALAQAHEHFANGAWKNGYPEGYHVRAYLNKE